MKKHRTYINIPEPEESLPGFGESTSQGLLQWISSVDHKMIGIMYLWLSVLFLLIGGLEILLIRIQLAVPNNHFIGPEIYNQLFTMHGTTMIFFVLMPAIFGFATYLVPLMIGANDMAFPRLNAFSFWSTFFGGFLLYFSFLAGGAPDAGWFNYAPLNEFNYSSSPGVDYYCTGLLFAGIGTIKVPIDAVILNAGGMVGKMAAKITPSGMNQLAATNILGNVVLVEELIKHDKLRKGVLFVSAEAVPGVKSLGMKPVAMGTSSVDEFAGVLDGTYFGDKFDVTQAYGYVKYAGTMWTLAMARKYPDLKFVVMSPGNTKGTGAPDSLPAPMRFMLKYVMMPIIFPLLGDMVHSLTVGVKRLVDGVSEDRYQSGVFYASREGKLSGDVVDQSTFYTDLKNTSFQDQADEAIHRFIHPA